MLVGGILSFDELQDNHIPLIGIDDYRLEKTQELLQANEDYLSQLK